MTHRLLVNPGTPQAWEIQLKPGANRIGRGEHNDFQIAHASISGTHCEIVVSSAGVILKDLGSTNGSFVNRAPVHEVILQSGHRVQLGSVDMVFESAPAAAGAAPASAQPPVPPPVTIRLTGARSSNSAAASAPVSAGAAPASAQPPIPPPVTLRFSGGRSASADAAPTPVPIATPELVAEEPPPAPLAEQPTAMFVPGGAFCKSHAKTPARFFCSKCRKYFCDLCVSTLATSAGPKKTCRACGAELAPVQVQIARPRTRGFFTSLPGAFVYPFRGFGIVILILATLAFSALSFLSAGLFTIFITTALYGFIFLFMQNIIHTTTADENEPLGFPESGGLFGAAFQLGCTVLASFGLAIGLLVAKAFEVDIPNALLIGATILGCAYFPMAVLAVAMKDSVLAANPLVVIPTILRMPYEYLVTAVLLVVVYGMRQLGTLVSEYAGAVSFTTKDMNMLFLALGARAVIAFVNVYLLTVMMRILGLLYNHKKDEFGWFSH